MWLKNSFIFLLSTFFIISQTTILQAYTTVKSINLYENCADGRNTIFKSLITENVFTHTYIDKYVADKDLLIASTEKVRFEQDFHLFSHGKSGEIFIENEWKNAKKIANWLQKGQYLKQKKQLKVNSIDGTSLMIYQFSFGMTINNQCTIHKFAANSATISIHK